MTAVLHTPQLPERPDQAANIAHFDANHIWHPYAPMPATVSAIPVRSARGSYLTLTDGRQVIDAMSSWWAACHGHGHPRLRAAAHAQIDAMSHVMFGGLTHEPAATLTAKLIDLLADGLDVVFYSDSGSVSVEVAIKMALQYQHARGFPERNRILTWRGGYHGDTQAPMSVCDPDSGMHSLWQGTLTQQQFTPAPPPRGSGPQTRSTYLAHFESCITDHTAAIIVEPVVQGAGGMNFHDHELICGLRSIADRHDILLIADEIATGFGRTGDLFATQAAGVTPDIICVGKALTGGFMSLAATVTTAAVARTISSGTGGGLMHGPTFMANPLACAVASANMDLIAEGGWQVDVPRIESGLVAGLSKLGNSPAVSQVRVLGAIGVVEMQQPVDIAMATEICVNHGVWLRPFGKLVYTMPPYIASDAEITQICQAIGAIVRGEELRREGAL